MSNAPESVPFVRRVLQISQTDERWFKLARHAAVVDQYAYSSPFTLVRQINFHLCRSLFLKHTQIDIFDFLSSLHKFRHVHKWSNFRAYRNLVVYADFRLKHFYT